MSWQVRRGGVGDLDALAPLWIAVHHRHTESMPELAPFVGDDETWRERRKLYAELLAKPDTVLLLASDGGALIGYGLAHVMASADTWVADTWRTGQRIGEIESLSVLPEYRGSGLGSELLDMLESALRNDGVRDLVLGVLPGNTDAMRLYERRGYRPTWMYLSKFEGR
ncbi:GNAT family N-acetyltransferase [Mycobacterium sp. 236(2023)]|uniref:GNAT family N-acetyltransferase n=1 Tax=Mycobacterium sp. 236(2023) TaxID=3038163 RepID=UPI00241592BB|nr:GNAT family N-acetyltransferase [Mycobacterium sp. 236(2023)]MDG4663003.1 GNAT family N-acetyltransferase [Mycobacterium sp. 236(2023)]